MTEIKNKEIKVGDKVKVLKPLFGWRHELVGTVGTITKVFPDDSYVIEVPEHLRVYSDEIEVVR